jgi:hypothetical protein
MPSQGPLYPGTLLDHLEGGANPWNNVSAVPPLGGNVLSRQDSYYADAQAFRFSTTLEGKNFGFNFSGGSFVSGIKVEGYSVSENGGAVPGTNMNVQLYLNGVAVGQPKAVQYGVGTPWVLGSSSDDWLAGLTIANVKSAGFGVGISVTNSSVLDDIFVDYIRVTVYYDIDRAPTATQVSPAAGATIGDLTPDVTIAFSDPDPVAPFKTFGAYQLQFRRVSDQVSFWDTGTVATTPTQQAANNATATYAGTVLVNGTAYEWRGRVQDGQGTWSDYTGWRSFTPNAVPNKPTISTPVGLTNTLTPTMSGVYNQGTGGTESRFQFEVQQGGLTIYSSGDINTPIATGQAYGTVNAGSTPAGTPPALALGTAYKVRMRSKDNASQYSDWTDWVSFNVVAAPLAPSNISPTGNAIVNDTTPDISWQHNDPQSNAQTAADIELFDVTAAAFVSGYNPKTLAQSTTTHTVVTVLTQPHQYRMRIRTKGLAAAGYGPYSDYQIFNDSVAPVFTLTAPALNDVESGSSLAVAWTFSGGSGTQQDYRVIVYADDMTTIVYDSGVIAGTALSYLVPAGTLHNAKDYFVQVTGHDTLAQAGATTKVHISTVFTPPATITGLLATPLGAQFV